MGVGRARHLGKVQLGLASRGACGQTESAIGNGSLCHTRFNFSMPLSLDALKKGL